MSEARDDDVPLDLGDPRHVKERARNAKARENIRATVLRNVMASIDGREWIFELLQLCHVYETSWSPDPLRMAANEGERNVGLQLIGQIQVCCPEAYLQMMKEAKDRADVRD